jgi:asparagine synthase (glutamine-hydrolysing)
VGLGHRRLSIIDVAGGGQPIFNEDGTIGVVFNGEIYNYRELRDDLLRAGHRFATASDTEVIVHAYETYGAECVERFRGIFAFAIWDGRDQSVFIARDQLGIKPLFYSHRAGRLFFASELKALLEDPTISRAVDLQALDDYLAYSYVPSDRSILRGVQKLAPGHWMRWRDGRLAVHQYWDARFEGQSAGNEGEWAERIEARLRECVRLQLRADVPLGIFLSGGVDSSAITALASQELGRKVKTFSVGFREADFDERRFARLTAERYGTEHIEITVADRDIGILGEIAYHLDEPFGDPSALPTYYVCREAARHVKVCLSGDGADELFAGYSRYRLARSYRRYDRIPGVLRRSTAGALLAVMPHHAWGRGELERIASSGAARYFLQMTEFTGDERATLLADHGPQAAQREPRLFTPYFAANNSDLVTTLQHIDQKTYLPDDILVKVDRMSMRHSLEARVPFLDHLLVEDVNAAPVDLKLRGSVGKYLLKRILTPHLPPPILTRKKMGFGIPIRHWFGGSLQDYARDWLLAPSSRCAQFVRRPAIERIIRAHGAGMRDFSRKIWILLMFEHWCRRYGV